MNITRLTLQEVEQLCNTSAIRDHYEVAGRRFADESSGTTTVDLFKYAAWLADGRPNPVGRKRVRTATEHKERKRQYDIARITSITRAANDIGEIPFDGINWDRRLSCKNDLMLFGKVYLPTVFYLPSAPYHDLLFERIRQTLMDGGKQSILLPRGGAKTTACRTGGVQGLLYGINHCGINVGANEDKALETMATVKLWLAKNPILLQDFPEVCYPLSLLGTHDRGSVGRTQSYHGEPTHVLWDHDEIHLPAIQLTEDVAHWYLEHDPDSVQKVVLNPLEPDNVIWMPSNSFGVFASYGIMSGIRGINIPHPISLTGVRPDFAFLDDVQNDKTSQSIESVLKIDKIISGAIRYLPAPGSKIAMFMPCTVITDGDLADTYGDPEIKPDWRGIRIPMVEQWPEGMDNKAITSDTETARCWTTYGELRRKSLREYGDLRDATKYYKQNRVTMDYGFRLSWPDRMEPGNVSAIQYAMNLRFEDHASFLSNAQQVGSNLLENTVGRVRWRDFASKTINVDKGYVPAKAQQMVAFIDIQAEYLVYVVLAVSYTLDCCFVADYGTFPSFGTDNYRRRQANDWGLLTKAYLHARQNVNGLVSDTSGNRTAGSGDVYAWALRTLIDDLLDRKYTRLDEHHSPCQIVSIAIDAQEGNVSEVCRNIASLYPQDRVIARFGEGISSGKIDFSGYKRVPGVEFEDMRNPAVRACRWYYRFNPTARRYELHMDVNAWKDYCMDRVRTPISERGSLTLYNAPPFEHELFSVQVCEGERPESFTSRGITRNRWVANPGADNEFLDCLVGCLCLASFHRCVFVPVQGVAMQSTIGATKRKPTFRERLEDRKKQKRSWSN